MRMILLESVALSIGAGIMGTLAGTGSHFAFEPGSGAERRGPFGN